MSDVPPNGDNHGTIDESERSFTSDERLLAQYLAERGHIIKSLAEQKELNRNPDALVDGIITEFKRVNPVASSKQVKGTVNDSLRGQGQARHIIIDARNSGLTEEEAVRALNRVAGITRDKLNSLRIVGDRFDVTRTYPKR